MVYVGAVALLAGICLSCLPLAQAQSTADVQWEPPINLSNTPGSSTRPGIAADQWGQVHVFWSEKQGGEPTKAGQQPDAGDTIYYRRWDGTSWSEPVDLFFTTSGSLAEPAAVIDSKGTLHLIWSGTLGIYYSQSPVLAPPSTSSWKPAELIASASVFERAELAIGPSDEIYVVYDRLNLGGQTFVLRSDTGGALWTEPQQVSENYDPAAWLTFRSRIVVDAQGRVHVTWIEWIADPEYRGVGLYYTRSDDHGLTWSQPFNLSEELVLPNESVSGAALVAIGEERLLVVYIAGDRTYRRCRVSTDAGQTWSAPRYIFGTLNSRAGWDAMAVDGAGTAHLILQLRAPSALYASYWTPDSWRDPPQSVLTEPPLDAAHYPQMVVSQGNQLHVVMEQHPAGEIWYMRGTSTAKIVPPLAMPIPTPAAPTATPGGAPDGTPVATVPTPPPFGSEPMNATPVTQWPVLLGIVSPLLLVGAVMLLRALRRR